MSTGTKNDFKESLHIWLGFISCFLTVVLKLQLKLEYALTQVYVDFVPSNSILYTII